MLKYDKLELVREKINPLINEAFDICKENDIPFFSFIMAGANEEDKSTDWVSTRMIPDNIKPGVTPMPESLWVLVNAASIIIKSDATMENNER